MPRTAQKETIQLAQTWLASARAVKAETVKAAYAAPAADATPEAKAEMADRVALAKFSLRLEHHVSVDPETYNKLFLWAQGDTRELTAADIAEFRAHRFVEPDATQPRREIYQLLGLPVPGEAAANMNRLETALPAAANADVLEHRAA